MRLTLPGLGGSECERQRAFRGGPITRPAALADPPRKKKGGQFGSNNSNCRSSRIACRVHHNPTRQRGNVAGCFPSLTRRVVMLSLIGMPLTLPGLGGSECERQRAFRGGPISAARSTCRPSPQERPSPQDSLGARLATLPRIGLIAMVKQSRRRVKRLSLVDVTSSYLTTLQPPVWRAGRDAGARGGSGCCGAGCRVAGCC